MSNHKAISEATNGSAINCFADSRIQQSAMLPFSACWYIIALCFVAIFNMAVFCCAVAIRVAYPYELDYGEGIVLCQTQRIIHFATAYALLTHYPYIVVNYPPLYYVVSLATNKLTRDLLFAGRLVSSLSTAGICFTLAWFVYRAVPARVPRLAAMGGAVLTVGFACGLDVMKWAPLMRVDMLGLWFTFAGVAVFVLARTAKQHYFAFFLFVAAVYTKQTLVAGAVTCLLVGALINSRRGIRDAAFTAAVGGAVLMFLVFATHGEILKHLFLYNWNPFSIRHAIGALNLNLQTMVPLLALAAAGAYGPVSDVARAFSRRTAVSLRGHLSASTYRLALFVVTVHFFLSGLMSLTVGKTGSNVNYLLEWNLSTCALAGLFVARLLWNWHIKPVPFGTALPYSLLLLMLVQQGGAVSRLLAHLVAASRSDLSEHATAPVQYDLLKYDLLRSDLEPGIMAEYAQNSEELLRILRNSPEPVMSEDMTLLYKAGKQVPFEPFMVSELAASGTWDETPLIDLIRKRTFSVMVIRDLRYRYSPAVARAICENYQPDGQYGIFTVYVPSR